jgi:hypothetical protein
MSDRDTTNSSHADETIDYSSIPAASLMRAAADGELDAEGEALLGDHADAFPGADRRVAFDRGLRAACAKAMAVDTPAGLADRVRGALAADASSGSSVSSENAPAAASVDAAEEAAFADAVAARSAETRDPSFWQSPAIRSIGAIAALLLIAVTAVFGLRNMQTTPAGQGYHVQLAQFVANEHDRVSSSESAAARKFHGEDPSAVATELGAILGSLPDMPHCDEQSVKFGGGSKCRVPGQGPSTHFQFFVEAADGVGPPQKLPVSVFVKRASGELEVVEGVTYEVDTLACGVEDASMYVWRRGDLLYVLVAKGADEAGSRLILQAMNVPDATARL